MIKFFLDQHGCAKNQVDGELLISHLEGSKDFEYVQTMDPSEADFIIVNSCGFINSAKEESINAVLEAKKNYPDAKIILAGCLAERYGKDFKENFEEIDGILGNGDISKITAVAEEVLKDKKSFEKKEQKGVCCGNRNTILSFPGTAFVKITEGCNNRCSFCAIPIIRGELRSRPVDEIIEEIKSLIDSGVFEINLIGQDLAAFGTDFIEAGNEKCRCIGSDFNESPLCTLLKEISSLKGKFAVRLLYIHPDHFNFDIIPVIKNDHRILPYFDIPVQSGDNEIIRKMNRKGTSDIYTMMFKKIRSELPEASIRTTFLAGFPGETDEMAENTRNFLKTIEPEWSGCFPYSKEEDTPAFKMKPQISKKVSQKRADELVRIQQEITKKRLSERVGKEYNILIEEIVPIPEGSGETEGFAIGRAWFQAPEVDGNVVVRYDTDDENAVNSIKPGRLVKVFIDASGDVDLEGRFISDSDLNSGRKSTLKFVR